MPEDAPAIDPGGSSRREDRPDAQQGLPAEHARQRVAWLGLGAMGTPMVRRLAAAGHDVVAYDPTPARVLAAGPRVSSAGSPASAAEGRDVLVVMVATPAQATQALLGPDGAAAALRADCRVVVLSTLGPAALTELAGRLPDGVRVVDAPVSGGVTRATDGTLLIMAANVQDDDRRLLGALGEVVEVGTRPGQGQAMKMVNQVLCGVHIAAAAEALALADGLGIDPRVAWQTVRRGAAASFMLDDRGARMVGDLDGPLDPGAGRPVRSAVALFVKDLHLVLDEATAAGLPLPVVSAAARSFADAGEAGLLNHDDSELYDHVRAGRVWPHGMSM